MAKSRLHHQICLCQLIDQLDEEGCSSVLRLLEKECVLSPDGDDLNTCLIKIIMRSSKHYTLETFTRIENKMRHILEQQELNIRNNNDDNTTDNIKNNIILFPLLRLPHDLIAKTSLYLNEKDIFQFEQCCRLFYKMINNSIYLKQSNNFKTFIITNDTLNKMGKFENSFFKYCKSSSLQFAIDSCLTMNDGIEHIAEYKQNLYCKWHDAVLGCKYHNMYQSLFKSMKCLKFNPDGAFLLDRLGMTAIRLLFDSSISNLESIELDHYWDNGITKHLEEHLIEFEKQYLQLKKELIEKDKKIQQLHFVKHIDKHTAGVVMTGPRFINTHHLWLNCAMLDLNWLSKDNNMQFLSNTGALTLSMKHTCMHTLELDGTGSLTNGNENNKNNENSSDNGSNGLGLTCAGHPGHGIDIQTLRLMGFGHRCNMQILNNKQVIKLLNLENSLTNLTIHFGIGDSESALFEALENVLEKKYYYQLENVNILLDIYINHEMKCHGCCEKIEKNKKDSDELGKEITIDNIFQVFKNMKWILKYQFKQLNIGLHILFIKLNKQTYHVFKWNSSIDENFLDQQRKNCYRCDQDEDVKHKNQKMFCQLKDQWAQQEWMRKCCSHM